MKLVLVILISISSSIAALQGTFPFDTMLCVHDSGIGAIIFNLSRYSKDVYLRDTCTTSCPGFCSRDFDLTRIPRGVPSLYDIKSCCAIIPPGGCTPETLLNYTDRQYLIPLTDDTVYMKVLNISGAMKESLSVRLDTAQFDVGAELALPVIEKNLFIAYPNPSSKTVTFWLPPFSGKADLSIYNITGIRVWNSNNIISREPSWPSEGYPAGIYIAKICQQGQRIYATRIILQK